MPSSTEWLMTTSDAAANGSMTLLVFDLETTGLDKETDQIVEFCFIEVDEGLEEANCWTQRVRPSIPIPPEAVRVHGITDAMVAAAPPFAAFAPRIQALVANRPLLGYNVDYDIDVLHYELVRANQLGISITHRRGDALSIFREFVPDLYRLTGAVRHYLARPHEGAHGAESDARAVLEVLKEQSRRHAGVPKRLKDLLAPVAPPGPNWLDRGKKFYRHEDGTIRFGFGKNRDGIVSENLGMLDWIIERDFPEETKEIARQLRSSGGTYGMH